MKTTNDKVIIDDFPDETGKVLLLDIFSGNIPNAAALMMKMDLMGYTATPKFVSKFLGSMISSDSTSSPFDVLYDCLKNDMFLDMFKDKELMANLVAMFLSNTYANLFPKSRLKNRATRILDIISAKRPGIIVGFYLKHSEWCIKFIRRFVTNQDCYSEFENYVIKLSKNLALVDDRYAETYHKRVLEKYDNRWNHAVHTK